VIHEDEPCVFNALQMAHWLHIEVPECALKKEATMLDEMKAECQMDAENKIRAEVDAHASLSLHSAPFIGLRNVLPSDVNVISPFIDQLMPFISRFRGEGNKFEIELALREALVNAIIHGNQNDHRKRVYVNCRCTTAGEVSLTVEDEGNGFEHSAVPDPTALDNRLRTNGRGIYLIRTLMDEVDFKQGGSVVHMRKKANAGSDTRRKAQ